MGNFFSLVPRWAIALVLGVGVFFVGAVGYKLGASAHRAKYDALVARVQQQELDALQAARETERREVEYVAELGRQHELRKQEVAVAIRAAVSDGERLRSALSSFSSSPSSSPTACEPDGRAATLANLLAEADRLAEESAGAAYSLAEQVRGLQAYVNHVNQE